MCIILHTVQSHRCSQTPFVFRHFLSCCYVKLHEKHGKGNSSKACDRVTALLGIFSCQLFVRLVQLIRHLGTLIKTSTRPDIQWTVHCSQDLSDGEEKWNHSDVERANGHFQQTTERETNVQLSANSPLISVAPCNIHSCSSRQSGPAYYLNRPSAGRSPPCARRYKGPLRFPAGPVVAVGAPGTEEGNWRGTERVRRRRSKCVLKRRQRDVNGWGNQGTERERERDGLSLPTSRQPRDALSYSDWGLSHITSWCSSMSMCDTCNGIIFILLLLL